MPVMKLILDGDKCWPELAGQESSIVHLGNDAPPIQVAVLDRGMKSGRPSVTLRFDLPDGRIVLAETSARLFCSAGRAVLAKFPDLFDGD